jgi:glycosyltransferase involved in cell wall biosynthesis
MNTEKIGLGLVTYKRPLFFEQSFASVPVDLLDEVVVVNDGTPYEKQISVPLIQHEVNKGVGISKNDAIRHLLNRGCDYIFLMEDDIIIKDPLVFQAYINAYKETGIHHFNYSQHGSMNKKDHNNGPMHKPLAEEQQPEPNPLSFISYKNNVEIALYPHCVGAFSFYTRKCLEDIGLIDEAFYNATEHLEHTYRICKANLHPPFWWFADLKKSTDYLTDIPWHPHTSTIASAPDFRKLIDESYNHFQKVHGHGIFQIPNYNLQEVTQILKTIYKNK